MTSFESIGGLNEAPSDEGVSRPGAADYHFAMTTAALDLESAQWLRDLSADGAARNEAIERLHALLLRVARAEAARRRSITSQVRAEEIDDLCTQAASDALMAILAKLETFRGAARFTTWACKFAILETSVRLRRHAWRDRKVEPDESVWNALVDKAPHALNRIESEQLASALQRAIEERLTERQRMIFRSAALDDIPIDVLAERLGTSRGAIYKTLHDARGKLRRALIDAGYGDQLP
jgi:RNA polymerase sigma-70 factor (ECF subfamily)